MAHTVLMPEQFGFGLEERSIRFNTTGAPSDDYEAAKHTLSVTGIDLSDFIPPTLTMLAEIETPDEEDPSRGTSLELEFSVPATGYDPDLDPSPSMTEFITETSLDKRVKTELGAYIDKTQESIDKATAYDNKARKIWNRVLCAGGVVAVGGVYGAMETRPEERITGELGTLETVSLMGVLGGLGVVAVSVAMRYFTKQSEEEQVERQAYVGQLTVEYDGLEQHGLTLFRP